MKEEEEEGVVVVDKKVVVLLVPDMTRHSFDTKDFHPGRMAEERGWSFY